LQGVPFREAYKIVGEQIENGTFAPSSQIHHTHEGSIGNLCNEQIAASMQAVLSQFGFDKVNKAIEDLIR
ncbi:MAG: argininosuccinate lyase, partial [Pedobacter sp.]